MKHACVAGFLACVATQHVGTGLTLLHPALNTPELFWLAILGALAHLALVVHWLRTFAWTGWSPLEAVVRWYAAPVLALAVLHVLLLAAAEPATVLPPAPARPGPAAVARVEPPLEGMPVPVNTSATASGRAGRQLGGLALPVLRAAALYVIALWWSTPVWAWLLVLPVGWLLRPRP
jgi:hypothetical protein